MATTIIPAKGNNQSFLPPKETTPAPTNIQPVYGGMTNTTESTVIQPPTFTGRNITNTPTSQIQKNLGLEVDNDYGPLTTQAIAEFQRANGLKVDGIFGPRTQIAYNNKFNQGSPILSTGAIHKEAKQNSKLLDAYSKYGIANPNAPAGVPGSEGGADTLGTKTTGVETDPFMAELTKMGERSSDNTKRLIASIQASKQRQANKVNKQYDNYVSGLQLLGIQTNSAQYTPELLQGSIQQAETEHIQKLQDLDVEENKALMDAENARADNDFKLLKERMDYVKEIKKDKADTLKAYNDAIINSGKLAEAQIEPKLAKEIYTTINQLEDTDKEAFINSIAQKFGLNPSTVVSSLTSIITSGEKDALSLASARKSLNKTTSSTPSAKEIAKIGFDALESGMFNGSKIGNPKGSDGYYDPTVVAKLYDEYIGAPADFVTTFKLKGAVNPEGAEFLPLAIKNIIFPPNSGRAE